MPVYSGAGGGIGISFKGSIDCSSNPNYPAGDSGDVWIVSASGKIGGVAGVDVQAGDWIVCNVDGSPAGDQAAVGANWQIVPNSDYLWRRIGTVLTPAITGDSATAHDYRTTKALGTVIGPNDWSLNADFSSWTGDVPDEFTVLNFGGGSGSSVTKEAVIFASAPFSVKIYGGTGGSPDELLSRSVTGLTPGAGYGFGFKWRRETGIDTDVQHVIIDSNDLMTATLQWVARPYKVTYNAASGVFTQGDSYSTGFGNGYILEVNPTYLLITPINSTVTTGETITSGLGITATATANAIPDIEGWFPIIPAYPISKTIRLNSDGFNEEGVTLTVPASGTIGVVWTVEDTKTAYLDDVIAATVTTTTGTVFDFINSSDFSTLPPSAKIFDFRFTGGTAGSALNLAPNGVFDSDYFLTLEFGTLNVALTSGDLTVGGETYLGKVEATLFTNNISGASTDYILHLLDDSDMVNPFSYFDSGSSSTPITTPGFTQSKARMTTIADQSTLHQSNPVSKGIGSGKVVSADKFLLTGDVMDGSGSILTGTVTKKTNSVGLSTYVGHLIDHSGGLLDYGMLSIGGDLKLGSSLIYGGTGAGPNVVIETANASGGNFKGGDYVVDLGVGSGSGRDGLALFKKDGTEFLGIVESTLLSTIESYSAISGTGRSLKMKAGSAGVGSSNGGNLILDVGAGSGGGQDGYLEYSIDDVPFAIFAKYGDGIALGVYDVMSSGTMYSLGHSAGTSYAEKIRILYDGSVLLEDGSSAEPVLAFNSNRYSGAFYDINQETIGFSIQDGITSGGTLRFKIKPDGIYSGFWNALSGPLIAQGGYSDSAAAVAMQIGSQVPLSTDGANILELFSTPINGIGKQTYSGADALTDLFVTGSFNGAHPTQFVVEIDGEGSPDTFKWSNNGGVSWNATGIAITGAAQLLVNGVSVRFKNLTGHSIGDKQEWDVAPISKEFYVDIHGGFFAGSTANQSDFTKAFSIISQSNTGATSTGVIGLVSEVQSDGTDAGYGFYGFGMTSGTIGAAGVAGAGKVSAATGTGPAYGGFFTSTDSHDGDNVAVLALAANGGTGNAYGIKSTGIALFTGQFAKAPSTDVSLSAGSTITITRGIMRVVGNGGAVTLTSTPTIADAVEDGTIVIIQGTDDTKTVTLQDESSLANSGLELAGGVNMTLGKGDNIVLMRDAGDDKYYEISRSNN